MEIRRFIDLYGDDVFAFALVLTKDYSSAKEVFVKTAAQADSLSDGAELFDVLKIAAPLALEADSNDEATTLSGAELSKKQDAVLRSVLMKPQFVRGIIHLAYENDLDPARTAKLLKTSERSVRAQLDELSEADSLDRHYKEICTKLTADDSLKAYVISAAERGSVREFEVKREAVPTHRWNRTQKIVVIIAAIIIGLAICFVIPIYEMYREMREHEGYESIENVPTDELFSYTLEVEPEDVSSAQIGE